ncbi:MAG: hypothetical protein R3C16_01155 [Hyphomonadaceae bacterium]
MEIGDLPLYDQDLEAELPASVLRFKREVEAATPSFSLRRNSTAPSRPR